MYPSVCVSSDSFGQIFEKFDVGDFNENLQRKFEFGLNAKKISGTLREDVSKFYFRRPHKIAVHELLTATCARNSVKETH